MIEDMMRSEQAIAFYGNILIFSSHGNFDIGVAPLWDGRG